MLSELIKGLNKQSLGTKIVEKTYVMKPGDNLGLGDRVGVDDAVEVDVDALVDLGGYQGLPKLDGDVRGIWKKEVKTYKL